MYTTDTWIKCPWLRMVMCTTYAGAHPCGSCRSDGDREIPLRSGRRKIWRWIKFAQGFDPRKWNTFRIQMGLLQEYHEELSVSMSTWLWNQEIRLAVLPVDFPSIESGSWLPIFLSSFLGAQPANLLWILHPWRYFSILQDCVDFRWFAKT